MPVATTSVDRSSQRIPADHALQHDRRRVQVHRNLGEDVREDRDAREVHAARAVEAPLQELRHREHVRAQVERHEYPAEDQQDQAREPLEVADRQARGRARAGEPDECSVEMFRRTASADREPADVAAGEEVVDGAAALAREVHADAEDDQEVDRDDADIEAGKGLGGDHGRGGRASIVTPSFPAWPEAFYVRSAECDRCLGRCNEHGDPRTRSRTPTSSWSRTGTSRRISTRSGRR